MYYLPLSKDAYESARNHQSISNANLKFVYRNICDAILYDGEDRELTNWARRNTLNMLHLVRFINYCNISFAHLVQDFVMFFNQDAEKVLGAYKTGYDYTHAVVLGKITITFNDKLIVTDCEKPNSNRDSFPAAMPIPVSSKNLKNNIVWYSRMYYYELFQRRETKRTPVGKMHGMMMYVTSQGTNPAELWGKDYHKNVKKSDTEEFLNKFNELITTNPEIL